MTMLRLQRKFHSNTTVMEMTFDVLSRLLTYNYVVSPPRSDDVGSKKGNDSISLLVREAFNSR